MEGQGSINNGLLLRFLKKETSEAENNEIFHWISDSEENRAEFRKIHQIYHLSKLKQDEAEIDIERAWNRIYSKIPHRENKPAIIQMNIFWKVAASVAVILALGFGTLWSFEHFSYKAKTTMVQIEAPTGEKSKIVLADGTHVWLNSQTILKYNVMEPRKVTLEGEAYFEVEKDRAHPFEVATACGMKVVVLGTKFNLRSFKDESNVETTLEEGKVKITGISSKQPIILKPGQQANYDTRNNKLLIRSVSAGIYSLWKNNELRFVDVSFADLVVSIERWYGVEIILDPTIRDTDRFTMTVKTESLRELLNMMQLTSKFDYEINGKKVMIHAK